LIPGLATRDYIREREIEWGRDSPLFQVHVLGEFAIAEHGAIFSVHSIAEAQQRWHDTPEAGRLFVGVDPAGATGTGDDSAFCIRRGLKVLEIVTRRGLTDEGHLGEIHGLLKKHRLPREVPVVVVDREGNIGSALFGMIRQYVEAHAGVFDTVGVRSSDKALRNPMIYDRMRDELAANLEGWFRDGGAIPEDAKLQEELHALAWEQMVTGKLKVTKKERLRKSLGRSPDRYDALALSVWEPLILREEESSGSLVSPAAKSTARDDEVFGQGRAFDPYGGGFR
jgi:hypothetical protein